MKSISILIIIVCVAFPHFLVGAEFRNVEQWRHQGVFGYEFFSVINPENQVVAGFGRVGCRIISQDKLVTFAPRGEGPGDLSDFCAAFIYKGDLAVFERPEKIKVFSKKGDTYVWKETKWLKRGKWAHYVKDAIYYDNKIFIAGPVGINMTEKYQDYAYVKVHDDSGNPLKFLVQKRNTKNIRINLMKHFITAEKADNVFYMAENELKVYVISSKKLELVKEVELEKPEFYKPMPENFYAFEKMGKRSDLKLQLEKWNMEYSGIKEIEAQDGQLVVQIRTANEKMKKFALLFYDTNTFQLKRIELINDFLLGAKDGRFYCFANGNPSRDDEADSCTSNIYQFK